MMSSATDDNSTTCRSTIRRPPTRSALLSRPPKRVARPPARMAALRMARSYSDMREAGIGRVLVASLHQGIADILPTRLTFYENWLNAEGLREGTIGLAPLFAVLSFLRQEGDAYRMITTRAGEYAADWTVQSMPSMRRAIIKAAPVWLRRRLLLRLARHLVRDTYQGSRAIARLRKGMASIDVRASVFCSVREPVGHPLCGFYAAAFTRLMTTFDIGARTEVVACRAAGEPSCILKVNIQNGRDADRAEAV